MESAIREIIDALKAYPQGEFDGVWLDKLVRRHNKAAGDGARKVAKKRLLPFYLDVKEHDSARYASWDVDAQTDERLVRLLRAKPRRTASGVATITVLTKPWPCSSACVYCPNDVRMPKSYLSDEPACQRAERNYFDPYLQVAARLRALTAMGHPTDKVELIVLGGTWSDYPESYQLWFISELFRALNEAGSDAAVLSQAERESCYLEANIACERDACAHYAADTQRKVNHGELSYNQAVQQLFQQGAWQQVSTWQSATWQQLEELHTVNETAAHRVVGLVIETRPDLISVASLTTMRRLGCTKVQMGIQSLDDTVLARNGRATSVDAIARAFYLLRYFGFKIHIHFMVNLVGATPARDVDDYHLLVTDGRFLPDEVKLYPCCLVESAQLTELHNQGQWQAYTEDDLVEVLATDALATPAYTRISRMIRDISAHDIIAGNKKTNLRQLVEEHIAQSGQTMREIRYREIATDEVTRETLKLDDVVYTTTGSTEHFLQWVTPENRIAGFLRLSLPHDNQLGTGLVGCFAHAAMIREVHVYGTAARLHQAGEGAQHLGLGRALVERACELARAAGFSRINVISAVGTRDYYRRLGFEDNDLYLTAPL